MDFELVEFDVSFAQVEHVAAADVDGDGDLDLVAGTDTFVLWFDNTARVIAGAGLSERWKKRFVADVVATHVAAGDMDGDGLVDVLLNGESQFSWARQLPSGPFQMHDLGPSNGPGPVLADDVDLDGDLDVIAVDDAIWLLENLGIGVFAAPVALEAGPVTVGDVLTEDLDDDGDRDLVATFSGVGEVVAFENDGAGSFTSTVLAAGLGEPTQVEVVDLGSDDLVDLVITDPMLRDVLAFENLGALTFGARIVADATAGEVTAIGVADFDGDGLDDLFVSKGEEHVRYIGLGGGSFDSKEVGETLGSVLPWLATGDFDRDGDADVLTFASADPGPPADAPDVLVSYVNDGIGGLNQFVGGEVSVEIDSYAYGDIDGDGDVDRVEGVGDTTTVTGTLQTEAGVLLFEKDLVVEPALEPDVHVSLVDVDFDADLDLVVGRSEFLHSVLAWYPNDGTGNFGAGNVVDELDVQLEQLLVGDVDGDGVIDVIVLRENTHGIADGAGFYWYSGTGTGFSPVETFIGVEHNVTEAWDVDDDGDLDLLDIDGWVENLGEGVLWASRDAVGDAFGLWRQVRDLDGDGDSDLVVPSDEGVLVCESIVPGVAYDECTAHLGRQDPSPDVDAGNWGTSVSADFDNDGDLDVMAGTVDVFDYYVEYAPAVGWIVNDGEFRFRERVFSEELHPGSLSAVDVDGDGWMDAANGSRMFRNLLGEDQDGDGLTDGDEISAGSDVGLVDTDSDGVLDSDEAALGTDPLSADTDLDGDHDGTEVAAGTDPTAFDTDGDGAADGSETHLGTDPLDGSDTPGLGDADRDALVNAEEVVLGTDPLLADTDGGGTSDGVEVRVNGSDPLDPGDDGTDLDGDRLVDEALTDTDPNQKDTDGDTLPDGLEVLLLGTDPAAADTDGDGLDDEREARLTKTDPTAWDTDTGGTPDGVEIDVAATDAFDAADDGQLDADLDGLSDALETMVTSTDPTLWDTDGDALSDADELIPHHTDPLLADTDGDLLLDYEEVNDVGLDFGDPIDPDSDDGGVLDGPEVAVGGDPFDASDDDSTWHWPTIDAPGEGETHVLDADGDGDPDLHWMSQGVDEQYLQLARNLGDGSFASTRTVGIFDIDVTDLLPVRFGDVDHDGDPDVIVATDADFEIHLNDGAGRFAFDQIASNVADNISDFEPIDIDADGDLDIAFHDTLADSVAYVEQSGGVFVTPAVPLTMNYRNSELTPADLDSDGDADLIVSDANRATVEVLENLGGLFAPLILVRSGAAEIAAGDVDDDGDLDLAFVDVDIGTAGWLENLGAMTFDEKVVVPAHASSVPALADIDLSGTLDLLVCCSDPGGDYVWYAQQPGIVWASALPIGPIASIPVDLDRDGDMDVYTNDLRLDKRAQRFANVLFDDLDGDGLIALDEQIAGTDPDWADTDMDGLPDPDELALGTDPRAYDTDGGLSSDGEEMDAGTDPFARTDDTKDSDGDGIFDRREPALGTLVFAFDTDGDLLTDRQERNRGTDPLDFDTDGDRVRDGIEVRNGTDPLDPADF